LQTNFQRQVLDMDGTRAERWVRETGQGRRRIGAVPRSLEDAIAQRGYMLAMPGSRGADSERPRRKSSDVCFLVTGPESLLQAIKRDRPTLTPPT
jgi:hypothetical protein